MYQKGGSIERFIALDRLHSYLKFVGLDLLDLEYLQPLRDEVAAERQKLLDESKKRGKNTDVVER